ncbi:MAG: hypothetical protein ACRDT2_06515 [Natronosporangium sp.]
MDVYEQLLELGRSLGYSEEHAKAFATGRAYSEREAREQWSGAGAVGTGTVPSGLYPEVERSVAAEAAAFDVSEATARKRVAILVDEKLPDTEAARRALLAHQGRLGVRR